MPGLMQSLFGHRKTGDAARRKPARRPKHKLQLFPENLEQRSMLTIVFPLTLYGPETDAPGKTNVGLQNPTVNLVFAGNWNLKDEVTLINAAQTLVNGPYLSGLAQYSSSGTAQYGTFWNDLNVEAGATLPAYPSTDQLQSFLQNSISKYGPDPGAGDLEHAPIEVVILDPASSIDAQGNVDNGGFNSPGTYSSPGGGQENINMVFVGTQAGAKGVSQDNFTQALSHELAERMVNNAQLFGLPSAYNIDGHTKIVQVADGEQEHNYNYRLDGNSVQAYWSDLDQAAIVPDFAYEFPHHNYVLTPSWNTQDPKNPFVIGYDLGITGDELFDAKNSTVSIRENVNGTVAVDMGNEPVAFDESSILNISDLAGGHLVVDDSADTSAATISLGSNPSKIFRAPPGSGYIKGLAQADIDYSYADTVDVKITGGSGNDTFVATEQQPPVPVTLQGGGGKNTLTGPNAVNMWTVSGANSGTLNSGLTFTGIQDLVGGASGDTFVMKPAGSVANIDGGGTSSGVVNTLDYTAFFTTPVAVDLATGSATNVNGGAPNSVENIQSYVTFQPARGTPHQMFVGAVFHDVLGRAPDPAGLAYWTQLLDTGTAISSVAQAIGHSDEYYANFVIEPAYMKLLGRAADDTGVTYWTAILDEGATDQQLEADFVSTPEFYKNAGGTNTDWIDAVYKLLLGRPADAAGENYWNSLLDAGETLNQVAQAIAGSQENNTQLINDDYFNYLGRPADPSGLAFWLSDFAKGGTNEDVIAGFTGSAEYYNEHTS